MADGANAVGNLVKKLEGKGILLSSDVDNALLEGIDIDMVSGKLIEKYPDPSAIQVVGSGVIKDIIEELKTDKAPVPLEIKAKAGFRPAAAEVEARYSIGNGKQQESNRTEGSVGDFVEYFRNRLQKIKPFISTHSAASGMVPNLESIKAYTNGRELTICGIVSNKITTKNGNIMALIEDETGDAKVMFMNGTSEKAKSLFALAGEVINDEVIAVKGRISGPFVIANELIFPNVPIKERKVIDDDLAVAFLSDVHVGSKKFMEKNFLKMVDWLNGNVDIGPKGLAGKIKYMVLAGDVADGIGVYPNQDKDLAILDVYMQYKRLSELLENIPDYIQVFVLPGNHDAVQSAEPQPAIGIDMLKEFRRDNIHFVSNPSYLTLHGIKVLAYHGTSLDSIISAVPNMSYSMPEKAMVETLKRRHLSPIYGGNIIVPSRTDNLVIDTIPDILHMGHLHKNGITNYHGVDVVNSGTWQARTDYQVKLGHMPTPCVMPVYDAKKGGYVNMDFNG